MKNNKHLSSGERDKITILQCEGLSIRKIAAILGRSSSTISREFKRPNAVFYHGKYIGSQTDNNVKREWQKSHLKPNSLLNQRNVLYFIECELKRGYTPEIICHELLEKFGETVSHETMYKFIYSSSRKLFQYLLRRPFGRKSRKQERPKRVGTGKNIPNRIDISQRPIKANNRTEFGHFEADSVESKRIRGQKRKSCLTVLVDRATRLTRIRKTASHTSKETVLSIASIKDTILFPIKSITYDNGKEFTKHEIINKILNTKSYFCKPYHSWEKGTVENINGLIRRLFPKGTDFDTISEEEIKRVEDWINNRPMKVLGFKTPYEKYLELAPIS